MTDGNASAADAPGDQYKQEAGRLDPELYGQLKQIAHARLARHRAGMTLNCTSLVHEAYLKLQGSAPGPAPDAANEHYLATASLVMRHILVDYARGHAAEKRGGDVLRVTLQESQVAAEQASWTCWRWMMHWRSWPGTTRTWKNWWCCAFSAA